jgi:hypothetical protein
MVLRGLIIEHLKASLKVVLGNGAAQLCPRGVGDRAMKANLIWIGVVHSGQRRDVGLGAQRLRARAIPEAGEQHLRQFLEVTRLGAPARI